MAYKIITHNLTSRGMRLVADIGDGFFKVKFNKEASDGIFFFYDFLIADYKNIKPCYRECMRYTDSEGNFYDEPCAESDHNYPNFHWACSLRLITYDVDYQDENLKWRLLGRQLQDKYSKLGEEVITDVIMHFAPKYDIIIDEENSPIARALNNSFLKHDETLPAKHVLVKEMIDFIQADQIGRKRPKKIQL